MEQQIRSGSNSVVHAWYREHAHPVLLPLDEEEMHLLRSMVGASRQLLHFLLQLQHALDDRQEGMDLAAVASDLQGMYAALSWAELDLPKVRTSEPISHDLCESIFWLKYCLSLWLSILRNQNRFIPIAKPGKKVFPRLR